jgi:hypothetical protein
VAAVAPATGSPPSRPGPGAVPARYSPHEYIGPFRPPRAARRGRSLHLILVPRVFRVNLELKDAPHVACTRTTSNGAGPHRLPRRRVPPGYSPHEYIEPIRQLKAPKPGVSCPCYSSHEYPERFGRWKALGTSHVLGPRVARPVPQPPGPARRSRHRARGSPQSTATMTNSASPRGVRTWTVSPAFFPTSALPTGDMFEIRPAEGSASGGPTSS